MRLGRSKPRGAPAPLAPDAPRPDPRVWGQHYRGRGPVPLGIAMVLILAVGSYFAYVKDNPFSDGFELDATFENAATLRSSSPVRVAGVNVGEVTSVESEGNLARVTFSVSDNALPIHEDATIEIRPRLFLEGNFFLELHPGTPSAPELDSGGDIPVTQTATAVQLDEVLSALDSDTRLNLQKLLEGYGDGLTHEPDAADDAGHDPDVKGETAAESLNDAFEYGGDAGRDSAIVQDALIGERPGDLAGLIEAQRDVFSELTTVESELQDLITNFDTTTGALAQESTNLRRTFAELAPTLEEARPSLAALSGALPPLRALALELEPSLRELPETIDVGFPWLDQTQLLLRDSELGGTASELARSTPLLAEVAARTSGLFDEVELLSRCATDVLEPTGDIVVTNTQFPTEETNYREFWYGVVNQAGETQNFDANGRYLRFQSGDGDELVQMADPLGGFNNTTAFGNAVEAPAGVQPVVDGDRPEFRMDVPCFQNAVPDVNGPQAAVGAPSPEAAP